MRVPADAVRRSARQLNGVECLVDSAARSVAVEGGEQLEVVASVEVGVELRRFHEPCHAF